MFRQLFWLPAVPIWWIIVETSLYWSVVPRRPYWTVILVAGESRSVSGSPWQGCLAHSSRLRCGFGCRRREFLLLAEPSQLFSVSTPVHPSSSGRWLFGSSGVLENVMGYLAPSIGKRSPAFLESSPKAILFAASANMIPAPALSRVAYKGVWETILLLSAISFAVDVIRAFLVCGPFLLEETEAAKTAHHRDELMREGDGKDGKGDISDFRKLDNR